MQVNSLNPSTLPVDDNVNNYAFNVALDGEYFVQKGKMIAYYGQIKFELLGAGPVQALVSQRFSSPLYAHDFMVATGSGSLILGDRGFDINSYDLEDGNLTVRATSLLGFEPTLNLKQSIIPGFLVLLGTGKFLASSNGPVHFVEPPIRLDPQAVMGWADTPTPCHHYAPRAVQGMLQGLAYGMGILGQSGEEHQFEFTGNAGTVIMQSSEQVDDTGILRDMESQVPMLGVGGLQQIQSSIQQRLVSEGGGTGGGGAGGGGAAGGMGLRDLQNLGRQFGR